MDTSVVSLPKSSFSLSFTVRAGFTKEILVFDKAISISVDNENIAAKFYTDWNNEYKKTENSYTFTLIGPLKKSSTKVEIKFLIYSIQLLIDDKLVDEEWPLGTLKFDQGKLSLDSEIEDFIYTDITQPFISPQTTFTNSIQFFVPEGSNTGVGDCMPFNRDGRYCLYYLFDRRGHKSKAGLGAHQWAQISSDDLKTWTVHPMSVSITEQWEGSICTGSLITANNRTYAFYAVRTSDQSPAKLTYAVSEDGVNFIKTNKYFELSAPYESVSARDPMVFKDAQGLFHMLVTTNLIGEDAPTNPGCLAHLTSTDLENWKQLEPFVVPGYADQPECSDYFEWNGWYYLVFSNFATARYRYSASPFGPWIKPEYDVLDSFESQVAKTAMFKGRRLVTGFLSKYPRTFAGYAITHELFQNKDGTLGSAFVPELIQKDVKTIYSGSISIDSNQGLAIKNIGSGSNIRLKATVKIENPFAQVGFIFEQEDAKAYHFDMYPSQGLLSIKRPDQNFSMADMRNQIAGLKCFDRPFEVDIIFWNDVIDFMIDGNRVGTMRAPRNGNLSISAYSLWGNVCFETIKLTEVE